MDILIGIKESALHAVEDFLISRFSWYSQIVRGSTGAKFDIIARMITKHFLKKKIIFSFEQLLEMVGKHSHKFFGFNDFYFMSLIHKEYEKSSVKNPHIREMMHMILYRESPVEFNAPILSQKLLSVTKDGIRIRKSIVKKIQDITKYFESIIKSKGTGKEWILCDIPNEDISFANHLEAIIKRSKSNNVLQERDPVKIVNDEGNASLLIENEHSVIHILSTIQNFIPSFYMNLSAYKLLKKEGAIDTLKSKS